MENDDGTEHLRHENGKKRVRATQACVLCRKKKVGVFSFLSLSHSLLQNVKLLFFYLIFESLIKTTTTTTTTIDQM